MQRIHKNIIFAKTYFEKSFSEKSYSMEFVDRGKEQKRLKRAFESETKKFVVIYGRRRLGKSTLLKRVITDEDVYFEAGRQETQVQISLLAGTIANLYSGFDMPLYPTWQSVLTAFNKVCRENTVLVLDEFPYMVEKDSSLPSVLQHILDSGELRYNLVICGSSQRMMQHFVLDSTDPLYGRAHEKMNLRPIRPQHWQEAIHLDAVSTIEEYSVWGGVPRYWTLREEYPSLREAINELILDEHGILYGEPSALFIDEANDIAPFQSIMTALGHGNTRYSAVASAIGKKTTEISKPLNALTEMSYISKEIPFGESEEKTKKTLYVIDDNFMAFYYTFIEPHRSMLALGRTSFVMQKIGSGFPAFVGNVWERLCQTAVSGNELFGHTWGMARRWWGKAPVYEDGRKTPVGYEDLEFDVVAEAIGDKNTILVGECKWKSADFADRLLAKLKAKTEKAPFSQGKNIVYVLFLKEHPLSEVDCCILYPDDVLKYQPE